METSHAIMPDYVERVYAGWLGKVIGVRHGANVENWTYEKLERTFGEITGYLHEFKNFAADDDTNGPMFFLRALEDYTHTRELTAEQIGLTWLNYAPDGHGFYWWGGYGKSTEHTAYLNLKNGIMAPRSGSIAQNGTTIAEQIGGQIFIDVWGLIAPGNPELAAEYAAKAASVSHDGNGKYGGMFIAACIAQAFTEQDIEQIIEAGLSVIPEDCEYARMTRDVVRFHREHPEHWRDCFRYVYDNYGYDRYPGACHIIPNSAVIVLSLLYSGGDFSRAINICNMCGWDTDCNVANVGTIMGVRGGLAAIDASWRKPINDFLCCSSVIGSLNMLDLPWCAAYIARFGYLIAGAKMPERWRDILEGKAAKFHFELPGSTHAFRTEADGGHVTSFIQNTTEAAASGERSLKVVYDQASGGHAYRLFHKTYYVPQDFNDSRYDPSFSPKLYPGQTVTAKVMVPSFVAFPVLARLYVKDRSSGTRFYGEKVRLTAEQWTELTYRIPPMEDVCIEETGVEWIPESGWYSELVAYLDDFHYEGEPDYVVHFAKERLEHWHNLHVEVSQLSYLRGVWTLEDGCLSGSYYGESAESYTGDLSWANYRYEVEIVPKLGEHHALLFRVQGGIRSYAAGLAPDGKLVLYKKDRHGFHALAKTEYLWQYDTSYRIGVEAAGNRLSIFVNGKELLVHEDKEHPYLTGMVGFANWGGSRTFYKSYRVTPVSNFPTLGS